MGNLSWSTNDDTLMDAFKEFNATEAKVVTDRYTGRSRGFGFVTFQSVQDAVAAREKMHNASVDGREIRVDVATPANR